jgi:hypothetical protein
VVVTRVEDCGNRGKRGVLLKRVADAQVYPHQDLISTDANAFATNNNLA